MNPVALALLSVALLLGSRGVAFAAVATPAPPATPLPPASPAPPPSPGPQPSASAAPVPSPSAAPSAPVARASVRTLPGGAPDTAAAPASPVTDYAKFVKAATAKQDGLFPLYVSGGKTYIEVRDDQLETDYLEHIVPANGLGGYGLHAGQQFAQRARLVRFHDLGKSVALVWPATRFVATPGTPLAAAVRESTADSVETVLPVVAEDKDHKTRILDASPLLGDLLDLGTALTDAVGGDRNPAGGYHLDPNRTYFGASKAFPKNDIIETDQTFGSTKSDQIDTVTDARFVQMRVKYNFSQILSTPGYQPRLYDDRVGFWEDPHAAFDRDSERDNLRWYILRWNMEASDPTQKISPAKKPIVFYLDRSIPDQYRGAVRDGILEWNKAFERIGISDAIQVLDPPADPAWDPDDIRYSVIRWVTDEPSEFGAEAQIVWDPRTGEIFRGGVLLDSNLGRFGETSERLLLDSLTFPDTQSASANATARDAATPRNPYAPLHDEDVFGRGEMGQAAYGATALTLMGQTSEIDTYVYQRIKAVAMHEVGHDFGLSHNFIAHNAFSQTDLKSASFTKANGTSSSVMDYWPVNIWPKGTSHGTYFPVTIGPYDYHVIHWGYATVPGAKTSHDEIATLSRWAQSASDPKYAFAGDEDGEFEMGHAIDPRAAPFVLSNHPMDWCAMRLDMTKQLMAGLDRRYPRTQAPWSDERVAFTTLLTGYNTCAATLTHYIAGEYLSRGRVGDPGVRTALTPVPRAQELRAYSLLNRYMFDDGNWKFSPVTLRRLVYTEYMPFADFGYDPTPRHDLAVVEIVGAMQGRVLATMFSPLTLQRLADMPTKAAPGTTMSLADLFTWTQDAVFAKLGSGRTQPEIRRNLQRRYAKMLGQMVTVPIPGMPLDAQALARVELANVVAQARRGLGARGIDLQTRAHLSALESDGQRALDVKTVAPLGAL